jgi:hypothetical protein
MTAPHSAACARRSGSRRWLRRLALCGALAALGSALGGCAMPRLLGKPHASAASAQQLQGLQLSVMRFADEYVGRMRETLNRAQQQAHSPEERLELQNWEVQQADAAYAIASGPNPVADALDMAVLASLSRMVVEDAWVRDRYGARAAPAQATYRALESDAWQLLGGVVSEAQQQQLRRLIAAWHARHPDTHAVAYTRLRDLATALGAAPVEGEALPDNLLSLLGIDPLAQLDPAVREMAQMRQLAERSIYYAQRAPGLLDLQAERFTYQLAAMPETRSLLGDLGQAARVGDAADELVRTLPGLLDQQRQAMLADVDRELGSQSTRLGSLAGQLRATLEAGTQAADATNAALQSFERIERQLAANGSTDSGSQGPPFDIRQYTQMLHELTASARALDALAQRADRLEPLWHVAAADTARQAQRVLDHLFVLLVLLVWMIASAVLLTALAYRRLSAAAPSYRQPVHCPD